MSFLDSSTFAAVMEQRIDKFNPDHIESGAYELSMGREYFSTNTETAVKKILEPGEQFAIEPGQFALLITKEIVSIPIDKLGFISIKAGIKFKGLINVSGFHVDPGFNGRLKFSVYNAGSRPITLQEGQRMFPMWLANFTSPINDSYHGEYQGQKTISVDDVYKIAGSVASPAVLNDKIKEQNAKFNGLSLEFKGLDSLVKVVAGVLFSFLILIIGKQVIDASTDSASDKVETIQKLVDVKLARQDSIIKSQNVKIDSILKSKNAAQSSSSSSAQ